MNYLCWDGEEAKLYVASADDEDSARAAAADAKGDSDGDEFSVQPLPHLNIHGAAVRMNFD